MDARAALSADYSRNCLRRRVLLLLPNPPTLQQIVQLKSQPVLHQKAIREIENDDEHHLVEQTNPTESGATKAPG